MVSVFDNKKVILASGSPRRIEMLRNDGVDFEIIKPMCSEDIHMKLSAHDEVMALALRKGLSSLEKCDCIKDNLIVLACDTLVVCDGKAIGKPKDETDAFEILKSLNNRSHQVMSGVCIIEFKDGKRTIKLFCESTDVFFKEYTDEEIREYIKTKEPMDKAGAYAIQGIFSKYIDHIEGSYNNVVGFPYERIKEYLKN